MSATEPEESVATEAPDKQFAAPAPDPRDPAALAAELAEKDRALREAAGRLDITLAFLTNELDPPAAERLSQVFSDLGYSLPPELRDRLGRRSYRGHLARSLARVRRWLKRSAQESTEIENKVPTPTELAGNQAPTESVAPGEGSAVDSGPPDATTLAMKLAEKDRALRETNDYLSAAVTFLEKENDPRAAERLSRMFIDLASPLSHGLHERLLRPLLKREPHRLDLTRSLVRLLHRRGAPPFPQEPAATEGRLPLNELRERAAAAEGGDRYELFAVCWQMVVQYPESALGWGSYARFLAGSFEWNNAKAALANAMAHPASHEPEAAAAILSALRIVAEQHRLEGVSWTDWFFALPKQTRATPDGVSLLTFAGRAEATEYAVAMLQTKHAAENADARLAASLVAFADGKPEEAYQHLHAAFEIDLPATLKRVVTTCSAQATRIIGSTGNVAAMETWLTEHSTDIPNLILMPNNMARDSIRHSARKRQIALDRGLPSPILIAQGKSASASVARIFNSGFDLPTALYSLFILRVIGPWLSEYLRGGACYCTHLEPSERNVQLLAQATTRAGGIFVHVRDPRQQIVSLMEHRRRYASQLGASFKERLPDDDDAALDQTIAVQLRPSLKWINHWVHARKQLPITFTTFEQYVTDQDAFIDRMLSIYKGDRRYFDREAALTEHAGTDYHRRKGSTDEWRTRLSPKQIETINAAIPNSYWNTFGWTP